MIVKILDLAVLAKIAGLKYLVILAWRRAGEAGEKAFFCMLSGLFFLIFSANFSKSSSIVMYDLFDVACF